MAIPSNIVMFPPYLGRNLAEMLAVFEDYKAETGRRLGSGITSASVNGRSYTYRDKSDEQLFMIGVEIMKALHSLDPENWPEPVSNFQGVVR